MKKMVNSFFCLLFFSSIMLIDVYSKFLNSLIKGEGL